MFANLPHEAAKPRAAIISASGRSAIEASRIAGHTNLETTSQYMFVAPERQNELTRRIQQTSAHAGKKSEEKQVAPETLPPATPTPETPPSIADVMPVTAVLQ